MSGIVIRHGHLLTMDPELGDVADGDVLVRGSQIAAVRAGAGRAGGSRSSTPGA